MFGFWEWVKYILFLIVVAVSISILSDIETGKIFKYVFGIGVMFGVGTMIARRLSKKHEKRKAKRIEREWAEMKERGRNKLR